MNKEEREQLRKEWEAEITAFKASGQTATAWCAAKDIKPSKFHYWLRKYKSNDKPSQSSHWLPVEVDEGHSNAPVVLIKMSKAVVEVKPGYDKELLCDVLRTLTALC